MIDKGEPSMLTLTVKAKVFAGWRQSKGEQNARIRKRGRQQGVSLLLALVALFLSLTALFQAPVASAAPMHEETVCVLACNPKTRKCGHYERGEVPRGYRLQRATPPGYKFVKTGSRCDNKMCLTKNKSICSTSPIGQAETAVDR
jgi:hypothetical protein